jgi:radical SAM protein with 4Fe4S-binding SPASM domain
MIETPLNDEDLVKPNFTKDNLPEWFCTVPFSTLIFNPWGNVGGCRELGNQHHLGDIRKQSWQEIWNGEKARAWRREFLTGNVKTCAEHQCHRKCHKENFNNQLLADLELSEIQSKPPQRISPDFNGQCNLRCEMCTIWKLPNGLYDEVDFWKGAEEDLFPHLKQVDPLAGEPLIQKDTFRLMDIMGCKNPKARWRITTNGHWKFSPFLKDKLEKVDVACINLSLDAVSPEVYARSREGGRIDVVLKTIDDIAQYRQERLEERGYTFEFDINMTTHRHNWKEMGGLVELALSKKATPLVQLLYKPLHLSLLTLSEKERQEIVDYYFETLDWDILKYCRRVVVALLESLPPTKQTKSRLRLYANIGTSAQSIETVPQPNLWQKLLNFFNRNFLWKSLGFGKVLNQSKSSGS